MIYDDTAHIHTYLTNHMPRVYSERTISIERWIETFVHTLNAQAIKAVGSADCSILCKYVPK